MLLVLPLHFWTEDIFQCIGDDLGKFLDYDRGYVESGNKGYVRILVHLDMRDGLVASLAPHYQGLVNL